MEFDKIKELVSLLEASKLRRIVLKEKDFELHLEKESPLSISSRAQVVESSLDTAFHADVSMKGERGGGHVEEPTGEYVTSPMVGTFYSAPSPDHPTFIKAGDKVQEDTIVCIIEAMKVMNEVKAGITGKVEEVLVDPAQPVEFGTRLFRIV